MNWSDERWLKLYVRDSESWLVLSWIARALLVFMLRKADHAGIIETRRGAKGLAAVVGMPPDAVETALPELLEDGCIIAHERGYLINNFVAAQAAVSSNKLRSAEYRARERERRRDEAKGTDTKRDAVTNRDASATLRDENATPRHASSLLEERRGEEKRSEISPGSDDPGPSSPVIESVIEPVIEPERLASKPDRAAKIPERAWKAADKLRELVLAKDPNVLIGRRPWGEDVRDGARLEWADCIRLIVERDGRSFEELWEVMSWLFSAEGELFVVQSPESLRRKWDSIQANRRRESRAPARGSRRDEPLRVIRTLEA